MKHPEFDSTDELVFLGFDDRRRLAVQAVSDLLVEQGDVAPLEFGANVLRFVRGEQEIVAMADTVTLTINRRIARGDIR